MIQKNIWRWMILDINGREKAKRFWIVASLLGICMFVIAIFCFFHTEKNEAEKRMVEIVNCNDPWGIFSGAGCDIDT